MSNLSNDKLLELTDETLSWGREIADLWTGTLYEKQIDMQIKSVERSLEHKDLEKVRTLVYDLARFLDHAEKEYNEGI